MRTLLVGLLLACVLPLAAQKSYFQQQVDYTINVTLNDVDHVLTGYESFIYTNNSPDELTFLYMHLWPNAYKDQNTALAKQLAYDKQFILFYAMASAKGYIDSLDFKVDGQTARWEFTPEHQDIAILHLNEPLKPGQSIRVETPFRVKLPSGSISRLGHIGQSYQITQWYPKPAVYDRDGWHPMPYLTQGEFYSEFGSFDVSITLPKNYVVGATGDLQNQSEIDFMNDLAAKGLDRPDLPVDNGFPESSSEQKTIRFKQKDVHDFGWFADKRWMVLKGEVLLPRSNHTVTTWALFTPKNKDVWNKSIEFLNDATFYYSKWNGDYPYNHVTAVDGTISAGGGMEYPNVTVIGNTGDYRTLEVVIMHEVGHNWFYGILGSNERDNAWMDEGINSFNEDRYMDTKYPNATLKDAIGLGKIGDLLGVKNYNQRKLSELSYMINAKRDLDQPLHCSSDQFTSLNYGGGVYKKTALIFYYLKSYLGEQEFDKAMQFYFEKWKFKHPSPADIQACFEESTGKDLSWFFNQLINTRNKIDFKVKRLKNQKDAWDVVVKNVGQLDGPVSLQIIKDGQVLHTEVSEVIKVGKTTILTLPMAPGANQIAIDYADQMPDINRGNNQVRLKGPFKKMEPFSIRPYLALENKKRTQLTLAPLTAWNNYDKWMIGASLGNNVFPSSYWRWDVSPLYSFSEAKMRGFASLVYSKRAVEVGFQGRSFGLSDRDFFFGTYERDYTRLFSYVKFDLSQKDEKLKYGWKRSLKIYNSWIRERSEGIIGLFAIFDPTRFAPSTYDMMVSGAKWSAQKKMNARNVLAYAAEVQVAHELVDWFDSPAYNVEFNYKYIYSTKKKKSIDLRLFYGGATNGLRNVIQYSASGLAGQVDYTGSNLYLGREETAGPLSRQFGYGQGMLHAPTRTYNTVAHLLAGNIEFALPFRFPVSLFASGALAFDRGATLDGGFGDIQKENFISTAGIMAPLWDNKIEVYCTLWRNKTLDDERKAMNWKPVQLSFLFDINAINPREIIRNIEP
ncbi:MAG: hypothetical protein RLZZ77_422 [Bacteroidota bacterium]